MFIVQINLNTCRDAHDLLCQQIIERNAKIALVSEPNAALSKEWGGDDLAKVWVDSELYIRERGTGVGHTWVEVGNMRLISCYNSPNSSDQDLIDMLDSISETVREARNKEILIGGDFNGKSPLWGSTVCDRRGCIVAEWIASEDLYLMNNGNTPTFRRRGSESHLDLTLCSRSLERRVIWEVLDGEETRSDHQYLLIHIRDRERGIQEADAYENEGWNIRSLDTSKLTESVERRVRAENIETPEKLMEVVREVCDDSMKRKYKGIRKSVYWWTEEIDESRKECVKLRRRYLRERRRNASAAECDTAYNYYKERRNLLSYRIRKSKENSWKKLCEELEQDIWGRAYKIVLKKIKKRPPIIPPDIRKGIIESLFPQHPECHWPEIQIGYNENVEIDMDELLSALLSINTKKAPGPDLISPKIVRLFTLAAPRVVLQVINSITRRGEFPKVWKEAKVALIPKPVKKQGDSITYRPICLLNTFGKLYEKILLNRLLEEVEEKNILSPRQYGFLPGRSTIGAIQHVVDLAGEEMRKKGRTRNLCLLIAIDIRNAFNSAPWRHIIVELEAKGASTWLVNILKTYLHDREVVGESFVQFMTAGVPQGSVIGPTLWNILYNGILEVDLPEGVTLIAYADDLAVFIKARTAELLEQKATVALSKISEWLRNKLLDIAPEKTEAALLSGRKQCRPLDISIMNTRIQIKKEIKYLGVVLDYRLSFGAHMKYVCTKADKTMAGLARILPNLGGVGERKRKILSCAAESVLLYAAPIWASSLDVLTYRDLMIKTQRKILIRTARAYRTVSNGALAVIASTLPIDLKAQERSSCFGKGEVERKEEREITLDRWQERWRNDPKGQWTRELIPDIRPWVLRRHGQVDFHLTQALSGHGCFGSYLVRFRRRRSPVCFFCDEEDTPSHTIFICCRWDFERDQLQSKLGYVLTSANLVNAMLRGEKEWNLVAQFINYIMRKKEEVEREKQRAGTVI